MYHDKAGTFTVALAADCSLTLNQGADIEDSSNSGAGTKSGAFGLASSGMLVAATLLGYSAAI